MPFTGASAQPQIQLFRPDIRTPLVPHKRMTPNIPPMAVSRVIHPLIMRSSIHARPNIKQQARLSIVTIQRVIDRMINRLIIPPRSSEEVQRFGPFERAAEMVGLHLVGFVEAVTACVDARRFSVAVRFRVDFEREVV